jgi:hypothetical protein
VTTKDIRTAQVQVSCDVCGRTLLRGEHSETYLAGGSRRQVCELCTPRALNEGWVREGAVLERGTRSVAGERRRSLLGRLRRTGGRSDGAPFPPPSSRSEHDRWSAEAEASELVAATVPEPRQVRAVPTSLEQRTAAAIVRFNASEHPRTVAGVARSLGAPVVVVRPLEEHGSLVTVVISWELCWYRYEIDLSDDATVVRPAGQGYELSEIPHEDQAEPNAAADEYGRLAAA